MKNSNENKHNNKLKFSANIPILQDKNRNNYKMLSTINKRTLLFCPYLPLAPHHQVKLSNSIQLWKIKRVIYILDRVNSQTTRQKQLLIRAKNTRVVTPGSTKSMVTQAKIVYWRAKNSELGGSERQNKSAHISQIKSKVQITQDYQNKAKFLHLAQGLLLPSIFFSIKGNRTGRNTTP